MLNIPKFKNNLITKVLPEGKILFIYNNGYMVDDHPLSLSLLPLINGERSIDEIIDSLSNSSEEGKEIINFSEIYYQIMLWEQQGLIIEAKNYDIKTELINLLENLNINLKEAIKKLKLFSLSIKALGNTNKDDLSFKIKSLGINLVSEDLSADLQIVLTDDYLADDLSEYNRQALARNRPWLIVKTADDRIWLGPLFIPDKTGCWECLAHRLRAHLPIETYLKNQKEKITRPPITSIGQDMAANLTIVEIIKWLLQKENENIEGKILTFDMLKMQCQSHQLCKRPQCRECGQPELSQNLSPLQLSPRLKTFTNDGGHRCLTPEETLRNYQHHISELTGIIKEVKPIDLYHNPLVHTYLAAYASPMPEPDLKDIEDNLINRTAGKGKTEQQARASAFAEAIERYSLTFQGDEPRISKSWRELGDRAIHPNLCWNFSKAQYRNRDRWNQSCPVLSQRVPAPFDENQVIEWTAVYSLSEERFKYLPSAYCYLGYPKTSHPDLWWATSTNGCAAGNTIEEAIFQGLMELIERDSIAIWWYNRLSRPGVDITTFDESYFQQLLDYYKSLDRQLWVIDVTSDLNIPSFAAISRRLHHGTEDIVLGFGTHVDAKIAISRALTEVNQILWSVLTSKKDGKTQYPPLCDPLALQWWQTATISTHPYLCPDTQIKLKTASDYPGQWSLNLLEDIISCRKTIESKGLEMLVLDATRPDIGLNTVRVIVPGLRHFWNRLGPGRLYDVPVRMGWFKEALTEDRLNPFPLWM